jgi:LemA protein
MGTSILLFLIILIAIPLGLMIWSLVIYNRFIRLRNQLREGWSGIDVQLKRRHDLVPSLVATVKGFRDHEKDVLEAVVRERTEAQAATDASSAAEPEDALSRDLGKIIAIAESYPEIQSNQHFLQLMRDLVEIEETLQYARRYYNGSVRNWNNLVESFPSRIIAGISRFTPASFFEIAQASERLPPSIAEQMAKS